MQKDLLPGDGIDPNGHWKWHSTTNTDRETAEKGIMIRFLPIILIFKIVWVLENGSQKVA